MTSSTVCEDGLCYYDTLKSQIHYPNKSVQLQSENKIYWTQNCLVYHYISRRLSTASILYFFLVLMEAYPLPLTNCHEYFLLL